MNLLQMSLSGAVMILVIVVIRALAINKLPKKAFLVLWGVVVARLLIPYSLRSTFSVYSLLERLAPTVETVKDSSPVAPFIPMAPAYNVTPMPGTVTTNTTASVTIDPLVLVWLIGALACAVFFAAAYWKCRKEFKASLPVDNEYAKYWLREHRIHRTIEIRQSGRISAPLTYGVFRPVILMPKTTEWDDQDTLKYVLTHEYVHIRRFDAVTKLVLTVALCTHWFNPAVWIMYVLANRDIELSCDEAVIREFGERTKSAYAMALIRMEETRSGLTPLCNNFSKNAIEERIIAIMKIKKTSLVALIVAMALVVGVTTAFATSAKTNEETTSIPTETPISTDSPQTPTGKPDNGTIENVTGIFDALNNLEYQPYTCDGLPEYLLTAADGTVYSINISEKWVWRGNSEQAELSNELIAQLKENADLTPTGYAAIETNEVSVEPAETSVPSANPQTRTAETGNETMGNAETSAPGADPQTPTTEPDNETIGNVAGIFDALNALKYQPYTCDGLPEYLLTAADGTVYSINFSEKWVWRGNSEQAELSDELITQLKENVNLENVNPAPME